MDQPGLPGSQFPGEDAQARKLRALAQQVQQLTAANVLATAGIGVIENGVVVNGQMQFNREDGTLGVQVDPATGTFVAYNAAGTSPVARFGALIETDPGEYGVEVDVGGTWVKLGAQAVTWDLVSGRPGVGGGATIDGSFITGTVPAATASTTSVTTAQTDGVTPAVFVRDVGGMVGSRLAVWMHDSGLLGFNTSSERYKKNIRDFAFTEQQIMGLRLVKYDRKATDADDYTPAVSVDELGLIAEEVEDGTPELAVFMNGQAETVRYELVGPALIPTVQDLLRERTAQRLENEAMKQAIRDLGGTI